jgi:zinc protease
MSPVDRTRLPSPAPDVRFAFPFATKRRMGNGLGLWTVERRGLPVASVVLVLPVGAALDPDDKPGLAAMTADMLDEGSGDRSAIEMQESLARIGTELDTEVGPDALILSLTLLERFVPEGLGLLADITVRPRLDPADFDRVRTLRVNRLRQLRDVPGVNAELVFLQSLYGTRAYGHLPIGSSSSLARMQASDVVEFHRSAYDPARATLIGVGAIAPDGFARDVDRAFGSWRGADDPAPPGQAAGDVTVHGALAEAGAPARLQIVDRPGAAQTELRIGHVAVARTTADFHALVLLNAVLGGHFMSRINRKLREDKGYTYGARSAFDFRRMAGPFSVQTSVQTSATGDAVHQVLGELAAIRGDRPASEDELRLSMSTLTKGYPRNFETAGQVARGLAQLALHDLPDDTFAEFCPRVRGLDAEDVTRAARAHIRPDSAVVVAVGDRDRIQGDLDGLGLGRAIATTADL